MKNLFSTEIHAKTFKIFEMAINDRYRWSFPQ